MGFFPCKCRNYIWGFFYGGIAQVIVGIIAFKRSNIFAATAFTSYGFFWITLVGIWMLPDTGNAVAGATPNSFLGVYLALWRFFTAFMWYGTWGASKVQQFVFLSLTVLFFLLALEKWTGIESVATFAGAIGIIYGSSAFYLAMAELLEEVKGKKVLPY